MADIYLRSGDGSDASDGLTWANAKATLAAALTAAGAGGTVYVSDAHAETATGSVTLISPGTAASPTKVICVDDAGDPEPPTARATTGTVTWGTTTGTLALRGYAYVYGVSFVGGNGGSGNLLVSLEVTQFGWTCEQCIFNLNSTGSGSWRFDVAPDALFTLIDSKLRFGAVGHKIEEFRGAVFAMRGGAIADSGSVPTTLFDTSGASGRARALLIGVDLATFGSGKTLFDFDAAQWCQVKAVDCKLGASVTIATAPGGHGCEIDVVNCDSADTNYRFYRARYHAVEQHETTVVRTGGASDGTTTFARKIVTTANSTVLFPYASQWMERWNETTGSAITVTVETVTDNVTLTDAEAWLEVEYLGTSGFPLGVFANDRVADPIFGTPANQTSSSETWTTTGLTTPVKQALAVTFTPQEKGIVRARVCVAKASTTVYYDPKLTVS